MKLFEIGASIKSLRKDKGLTQADVAKVAGISRVTLGKLERGQMTSISIKTLDLILHLLDHEITFTPLNQNSFGLPNPDSLAK